MTATDVTATAADAELVAGAVRDVLRARCDRAVVDAAEAAGWAPDLWAVVADGGFPWVSVPESAGGPAVGGSVAEACAVLEQIGRYAAPLPVAETGLLGGWLLASAGLPVPAGPVTTAPTPPGGRRVVGGAVPDGAVPDGAVPGDAVPGGAVAGSGASGAAGPVSSVVLRRAGGSLVADGVVSRVPWARAAERIVLLADGPDGLTVASLDPSAATITPGTNLAGGLWPSIARGVRG